MARENLARLLASAADNVAILLKNNRILRPLYDLT